MSTLTVTHQTTVTDDQIDHLGHMNVRFYGVAARAATDAAVAALGGDRTSLVATDLYTRFFREQLVGARLEVRTGVLERGDAGLRLYHELGNVETGDLAASFVQQLRPVGGAGAPETARFDHPDAFATLTDIPARGRPRSIRLDTDPIAAAPDLETALERGLAMRIPRPVTADECTADGSYRATDAPMLLWGGEPLNGASGPSLYDGEDGQKIGWAAMENRLLVHRLPRRGDRIQSFGAVLEIHDKATHRVLWAFDVDRGDLLVAFEVVDLAFDTVQRRAVTIPDDLRANAEAIRQPDLAPAPLSSSC